MDFTDTNEENEVMKVLPEEPICKGIAYAATEIDVTTQDLTSFGEHPETISGNWIESILQDTRPLAQWLNLKSEEFHENCNGVAFAQCPFLHPCVDLPSENQNRKKEDLRNQNSLALETALSRISKGQRINLKCSHINDEGRYDPDIKTTRSLTYGIHPNVAIDNYCHMHAYSRARLLRTDRRELANELLEQMSTDTEPREILATRSPGSDSPLLCTKTVAPTYKGKDIERCSKTGENPPVRRNMFMEEPLRISPCIFFPSEVLIESRKGFIRRHKSVPRFTSK